MTGDLVCVKKGIKLVSRTLFAFLSFDKRNLNNKMKTLLFYFLLCLNEVLVIQCNFKQFFLENRPISTAPAFDKSSPLDCTEKKKLPD